MKMKLFSIRTCVVFGFVVVFACRGALAAVDIHVKYVAIHENARYGHVTGQTVAVFAHVRNEGDETAAEYRVDFYLSRDTEISAADYLLASTTRQNVAPRDSYGHIWVSSATIPYVPTTGRYYLGVIVTCEDDDNLENNTWCNPNPRQIIVPPADLSFQMLTPGESVYRPGEPLCVRAQVFNSGHVRSAGYRVEFYVGESLVGSASRPGVGHLSVDAFDATCAVPASVPGDFYSLAARIICPDDCNPQNNETLSARVFYVGPYPDLIIQRVAAVGESHMPGGEIVLSSLVKNVGDAVSASYRADYYVSADADIATEDHHVASATREGLEAGMEHSFDVTGRLPSYLPEGECYVGAIITCSDDGRSGNNTKLGAEAITIVHKQGYLCGQMRYEDICTRLHPIRYARLEVYGDNGSSSTADDRLIKATYTDDGGNYGTLVPESERHGQRFYVKVFAQGVAGACPGTTKAAGEVRDNTFKNLYFLKSDSCTLPQDSSLTVNVTSPMYGGGAFMVFDSVVEGFLKATACFGTELDEVTTYWPSSDGWSYYYPGVGIFIAQEDRMDRDVIMHEYGHHLAEAYEFAQGEVGDYPLHYWDRDLRSQPTWRTDEHARNLAFREAWATLFSIASQMGDKSYPGSGDTLYQDTDEPSGYTFTADPEWDTKNPKSPGEFYENMNCCTLWDIFDEATIFEPRDTLSDPALTMIWTVLCEHQPEDIIDFWNGWFECFEHAPDMTRIFRDHQMPFRYSITSPTVEGFETGDFNAFAWTAPDDVPWTICADTAHEGTFSAQAGAVEYKQSTTLEIEIDCDDGWVTFWPKMSTCGTRDKLKFYIDGVMKADYSGVFDWKQVAFPIDGGSHRFTWTYTRNQKADGEFDTVWLDAIEFPIWPESGEASPVDASDV